MIQRKVGAVLQNFELPEYEAIDKAAEIGLDGIQMYVTCGLFQPETLDAAARKDLRQLLADKGLEISALCAQMKGHLCDPGTAAETLERTKRCIDLAVDLGTDVVTTHVGRCGEDENAAPWQCGLKHLKELGTYCVERGVRFAAETGPENPLDLRKFLQQVDSDAIRINYDPANLRMRGFDQIGGVKILGDYIVHTHAKDGKREPMEEVPLGTGEVDFPKYLAALDEIGYDGYLTIEREGGDDRVGDIAHGAEFLRKLMKS